MTVPTRMVNEMQHRLFRWWLAGQRERQDAVGDFARDYLSDDCARGLRTLSGIDRHLRDCHGVAEKVLASRDQAWREFAATLPEMARQIGGQP